MIRINAFRNIAGTRDSVAWGSKNTAKNIATNLHGNISALVFAAVLIVCSVTAGCSSQKPQPISSNNQIPATQPPSPIAPAPVPALQAENKPAPKKAVHKKPATVNYTDKTYGVTFEYPRRYAIETGDAAADLLTSSPIPMNFVAPGGVALAAVELPETSFANTDFSSAFFNVSVHKNLTADQCNEFAVPMPKEVATAIAPEKMASEGKEVKQEVKQEDNQAAKSESQAAAKSESPAASTETAKPSASTPVEAAKADAPSPAPAENAKTDAPPPTCHPEDSTKCSPNDPTTAATSNAAEKATPAASGVSTAEPQGSKLLLGDMELRATEAVSGEGTRQSDSKYFHVYQNGSCYEFALNVTTVASQDGAGLIKHVDRDKVFTRLEKILDTVKIDTVRINPVAPEATAEAPATPVAAGSAAQ